MSIAEDVDLYDDLDNLPCENIQKLKSTLNESKRQIEELRNEIAKLQNENKILSKNASSLLLTSGLEITRKSKRISSLEKERDDILFRRNVNKTLVQCASKEDVSNEPENKKPRRTGKKSKTKIKESPASGEKSAADGPVADHQLMDAANEIEIRQDNTTSVVDAKSNADNSVQSVDDSQSQFCDLSVSITDSNLLRTPLKFVNNNICFSAPFDVTALLSPCRETPDIIKFKYGNSGMSMNNLKIPALNLNDNESARNFDNVNTASDWKASTLRLGNNDDETTNNSTLSVVDVESFDIAANAACKLLDNELVTDNTTEERTSLAERDNKPEDSKISDSLTKKSTESVDIKDKNANKNLLARWKNGIANHFKKVENINSNNNSDNDSINNNNDSSSGNSNSNINDSYKTSSVGSNSGNNNNNSNDVSISDNGDKMRNLNKTPSSEHKRIASKRGKISDCRKSLGKSETESVSVNSSSRNPSSSPDANKGHSSKIINEAVAAKLIDGNNFSVHQSENCIKNNSCPKYTAPIDAANASESTTPKKSFNKSPVSDNQKHCSPKSNSSFVIEGGVRYAEHGNFKSGRKLMLICASPGKRSYSVKR